MFAWNGKYFQLPMVNLWPRPIQKPHPPVWVPGSGSLSTWDFSAKHDHCYCFLSYWGSKLGKKVMDGFWEFVGRAGVDAKSVSRGLPAIGRRFRDRRASREGLLQSTSEYFYDKCLHIPPE